MRLRQRNLREVTVLPRVSTSQPDGTTFATWQTPGRIIRANIQPAGGRLMAEMYGQRLANMLTLYAELGTQLSVTDGVCVEGAEEPNYQVVAVRQWGSHLVADLERVK